MTMHPSRVGAVGRAAFGLGLVLVAGCDEDTVETYERTFHVDDHTLEIAVRNTQGDLEIASGVDDEVHVSAKLQRTRISDVGDEEARDAVRIEADERGDTLDVVALLSDPPRGYHLDVFMLVPPTLHLSIDDGSGDIVISDVGSVYIDDDSGDIEVVEVAGGVRIDDDSGDVLVQGVGGDVEISDDSGDIRIDDVHGDVDVDDDSGDMSIEDVSGRVTIRDGSGDIAVRNAGGVRILEDGSGDVSVR